MMNGARKPKAFSERNSPAASCRLQWSKGRVERSRGNRGHILERKHPDIITHNTTVPLAMALRALEDHD
jgi:hypothetical protein